MKLIISVFCHFLSARGRTVSVVDLARVPRPVLEACHDDGVVVTSEAGGREPAYTTAALTSSLSAL